MRGQIHREPGPARRTGLASPAAADRPVLEIRDLSVWYETPCGPVDAVRRVSVSVARGEILGIVGESGCGKSSLAYAVMGYLGPAGRLAGEIWLDGMNLGEATPAELQQIRGSRLAMVYQDPLSTLNPSMRIGEQIAEVYRTHRAASTEVAAARAVEMLGKVGLGDPEEVARRYPHQLSGGMQQRVVIAMALCCDPDVLIMDEPTTALDVTTQARILDLLRALQSEAGTAILYISHNLGVIAQLCHRVAVMYAGEIVEESTVEQIFRRPSHPYTLGLLRSLPRLGARKGASPLEPIPGSPPRQRQPREGCAFAPRCAFAEPRCRQVPPEPREIFPGHRTRCHRAPWLVAGRSSPLIETTGANRRLGRLLDGDSARSVSLVHPAGSSSREPILQARELTKHYSSSDGLASWLGRLLGRHPQPIRAVDGISFEVVAGQTLALVGESGCGKTTLARCIAGLTEITAGQLWFAGTELSTGAERRHRDRQRQIQMVFQNPHASLNPRQTIGDALARPLYRLLGLRGDAAKQRVGELLEAVNLDPGYAERYPGQLSGGEKQRVAIARAFAGQPDLIILDEPVSALDVSVQAAILNLLVELQRQHGTTYLFISHDLSVVRYVADWIGVVYLGQLCELGPTDEIFRPPHHPYTEALLSAVPLPDPEATRATVRLEGAVPSPKQPPRGCPFHTRCPRTLGEQCAMVPPPVRHFPGGHQIRCHLQPEALHSARLAPPSSGVDPPG